MCSPRLTYIVISIVLLVMAVAYLGVTIAFMDIFKWGKDGYHGDSKWWPALAHLPYLFPGVSFLIAGVVGICVGTCNGSAAMIDGLRNGFMVLCIASIVVTAYTPYAVGGKGPMGSSYGSNPYHYNATPEQLLTAGFFLACITAAVCVCGAIVACCCRPQKRQYV